MTTILNRSSYPPLFMIASDELSQIRTITLFDEKAIYQNVRSPDLLIL